MKQILADLKGEIDNITIIAEDIQMLLSVMDRTMKQTLENRGLEQPSKQKTIGHSPGWTIC
jgi:hypothetical protein